MESKTILLETLHDINNNQLNQKGYYVDCIIHIQTPGTIVFTINLTRMSTQEKVTMTTFLDNALQIKETVINTIDELMEIMGVQ